MLNGLPVLRAYKLESDFLKRQVELTEVHRRSTLAKLGMDAWFAQRLGWLSFMINFTSIAYCLFSPNRNGATAGLLLTWASTLDEDVVSFVYALARLENRMVSVERVANFMDIEPEVGYRNVT